MNNDQNTFDIYDEEQSKDKNKRLLPILQIQRPESQNEFIEDD